MPSKTASKRDRDRRGLARRAPSHVYILRQAATARAPEHAAPSARPAVGQSVPTAAHASTAQSATDVARILLITPPPHTTVQGIVCRDREGHEVGFIVGPPTRERHTVMHATSARPHFPAPTVPVRYPHARRRAAPVCLSKRLLTRSTVRGARVVTAPRIGALARGLLRPAATPRGTAPRARPADHLTAPRAYPSAHDRHHRRPRAEPRPSRRRSADAP